jgi:hypothetical protein
MSGCAAGAILKSGEELVFAPKSGPKAGSGRPWIRTSTHLGPPNQFPALPVEDHRQDPVTNLLLQRLSPVGDDGDRHDGGIVNRDVD